MRDKPSCPEARSFLIDIAWKEGTACQEGLAGKEELVLENAAAPLRGVPPWVASHVDSCPSCKDFFREILRIREWAICSNIEIPGDLHVVADAIAEATGVSQHEDALDTARGVEMIGDEHHLTKAALQFVPLGVLGLVVNWGLLWWLKPLGFALLNAVLNWLTPFLFFLVVKYLPGVLEEDPVAEKEGKQ